MTKTIDGAIICYHFLTPLEILIFIISTLQPSKTIIADNDNNDRTNDMKTEKFRDLNNMDKNSLVF